MTTPTASESRGPLTQREHDVLQAIVDGLNNRETATALSISPETVRSHVKSILFKLQARDRTQAAIKGLRAGLVVLRTKP